MFNPWLAKKIYPECTYFMYFEGVGLVNQFEWSLGYFSKEYDPANKGRYIVGLDLQFRKADDAFKRLLRDWTTDRTIAIYDIGEHSYSCSQIFCGCKPGLIANWAIPAMREEEEVVKLQVLPSSAEIFSSGRHASHWHMAQDGFIEITRV